MLSIATVETATAENAVTDSAANGVALFAEDGEEPSTNQDVFNYLVTDDDNGDEEVATGTSKGTGPITFNGGKGLSFDQAKPIITPFRKTFRTSATALTILKQNTT